MSEAIIDEVFAALDIVILERLDDGSFRTIGTVPEWFIRFYPNAVSKRDKLRPEENFSFLANFIVDAEIFWQSNEIGPLKSGIWIEVDRSGNEIYLEVSAVRLKARKILLVELLGTSSEERLLLIQKARESSLRHQSLVKEIQKKEILIHCVMHDLAGQLTGINCCFALLASEELTPKGRERLEIGRRQCTKQETLIREILDAFSAEAESLETFNIDLAQAPDALICVMEVMDALLPTAIINKINLRLDPTIDMVQEWKVVGEKSRLERVLSNLLENALRHSPPNSTVTAGIKENSDSVLLTIDDEGSGVPPDICQNLFQKFSQGKEKSGKAGLGLYFCRITVECWGGSIGYLPRSEGGSQFWFRLLKPNRA